MGPNEANIWFYIKDRQQKGPVGIFELTKLFEQGVLNGDTYLWTEGTDTWKMAKSIKSFKHYNSAIDSALTEAPKIRPSSKPLLRIIAKVFDLSLFTVILSTFISIFSLDLILKSSKITLFIIFLLLWILVEPIMLSIFGTTIGKSLLNLKVKNVHGELLDYLSALKRNLYILFPGKGFGYPLMMLTLNSVPLFVLREKPRSIWDEKAETIVLYGAVNKFRVFLGTCFPLAIFIMGIFISA